MLEQISECAWTLSLLIPAGIAVWLGWHLGDFMRRVRMLVHVRRRIRAIERDMIARGFERDLDGNWHSHREDP